MSRRFKLRDCKLSASNTSTWPRIWQAALGFWTSYIARTTKSDDAEVVRLATWNCRRRYRLNLRPIDGWVWRDLADVLASAPM